MGSSFMFHMLPLVAVFLIMYFLIIRPQNKKMKDLRVMRDNLKADDEIMLSGGIYGKVTAI